MRRTSANNATDPDRLWVHRWHNGSCGYYSSYLKYLGAVRCPTKVYLLFDLPMLGNRFFTAAFTFFCSAEVPC